MLALAEQREWLNIDLRGNARKLVARDAIPTWKIGSNIPSAIP